MWFVCWCFVGSHIKRGSTTMHHHFFFSLQMQSESAFFSLFSLPHRIIFFLARWKLSVKTIRRVLFINTCIVFLLICTDIMAFLTFNRSACWRTAFERLVKSWNEEFCFCWEIFFFCSFYESKDSKKKSISHRKDIKVMVTAFQLNVYLSIFQRLCWFTQTPAAQL